MADEFSQKSQTFLDWLMAVPGVIVSPSIQLTDYRERGAGRGVRSIQNIDVDTDLFFIPRECVISVENSALSKHLPQYFTKSSENDDTSLSDPFLSLNLVLIYEYLLGEKSRWKAYFDVLPHSFETLMFWTEDELNELQGSAAVHKVGMASADALFTEYVVPVIRRHADVFVGSADITDEGLMSLAHRMGSTTMSYAFDFESDEEEEEEEEKEEEVDENGFAVDDEDLLPKGMVPLADMLNADAEPNASLFQVRDGLAMRSLKPIPAGTEILNDYGQLPRSDLLRRYGYITPSYARYDCVEVSRNLIDSCLAEKDYADRIAYMEDRDMVEEAYDIMWPDNSDNMDFFPRDLSQYVKVMIADDDKWKDVAKSGICDEELLAKFKDMMTQVVTMRRRDYATTIAEDVKMLEDTATTGRLRTAVEVRLGEKKILAAALDRLRQDSTNPEAEPTSKKQRTG